MVITAEMNTGEWKTEIWSFHLHLSVLFELSTCIIFFKYQWDDLHSVIVSFSLFFLFCNLNKRYFLKKYKFLSSNS